MERTHRKPGWARALVTGGSAGIGEALARLGRAGECGEAGRLHRRHVREHSPPGRDHPPIGAVAKQPSGPPPGSPALAAHGRDLIDEADRLGELSDGEVTLRMWREKDAAALATLCQDETI